MIEERMISRVDLAKRLGVKPATIAKWERGWFPKPLQRVSDRLILYAVDAVERARVRRRQPKARKTRRRATRPVTGRSARYSGLPAPAKTRLSLRHAMSGTVSDAHRSQSASLSGDVNSRRRLPSVK